MRLRLPALVALLLLVTAVGAGRLLYPDLPEVRVSTVDVGDLEVRFVASGEVAFKRAVMAAPDAGTVREVLVQENQAVKASELLARFDAPQLRSRVYALRAAHDAARHRLLEALAYRDLRTGQIDADIQRARADAEQARTRFNEATSPVPRDEQRKVDANLAAVTAEWDRCRLERTRLEGLYRSGAVSLDALERARAGERGAAARRAEARAQCRLVRAVPSPGRMAVARADLDRSRQGVVAAEQLRGELRVLDVRCQSASNDLRIKAKELRDGEEMLDGASLRAPFAGVISQVLLHPGDHAGGGQPILALVSRDHPWVDANVDEQDSSRVSVGQPVIVRVGAVPGKSWNGTVDRVAPSLESPPGAAGNARFLRIRVDLKVSDADLRAGMAAEVEGRIVLASRALLIPRSAVVQGNGQGVVMGVHEGRILRVPVRLGAGTADQVQILAGPAAGMQVVAEGADRLTEGMRVRVVR